MQNQNEQRKNNKSIATAVTDAEVLDKKKFKVVKKNWKKLKNIKNLERVQNMVPFKVNLFLKKIIKNQLSLKNTESRMPKYNILRKFKIKSAQNNLRVKNFCIKLKKKWNTKRLKKKHNLV